LNIGYAGRVTAFITREGFELCDVTTVPSGRIITAGYANLKQVNVYATSVTAKRTERKAFVNNDLPGVLGHSNQELLVRDFNCALTEIDATGCNNHSRALATLIQGFALRDVWQADGRRKVYTHYTSRGASHLDRFYVTNGLWDKKQHFETLPATFTDHLAVVLHLSATVGVVRYSYGPWNLNCAILPYKCIFELTRTCWSRWKGQQWHFTHVVQWWVRYCKPKVRTTLRHEEACRCREQKIMEHYYYSCIYDLLASEAAGQFDVSTLNHFKAKIVNTHAQRMRVAMIGTEMADLVSGEQPTLYQCVRKHKRRTNSVVQAIRDEDGNLHVTPSDIAATFVAYFQKQYSPIDANMECTDELIAHIDARLTADLDLALLAPFTGEDMLRYADALYCTRSRICSFTNMSFSEARRKI
jgi:hypothetical protein